MNLTEAARIAGVPQPTASRWLRAGLIQTPEDYVGRMGAPVNIGPKELRELCNIAQLRQELSLQALKRAARFLREELCNNPFSTGRFMVLEGRPGQRELVKVCTSGEAIALVKDRGQMLLFPVIEPEDCVNEDGDKEKQAS